MNRIYNIENNHHNPYRFGFNSQEKTDEIAGEGNHNTALFWEYDTRTGRRWNLDPVVKPWESGYATYGNSPIYFVDNYGKTGVAYLTDEVNPNTNRPILRVVSKNYIYGQDANDINRGLIQTQLENQFNNNGDYFTYAVDGKLYDVVFDMETIIIDKADIPGLMYKEDEINYENNFYEIRDDVSSSWCFSSTMRNPNTGGNAGVLKTSDIANQSPSHEKNHDLAGVNKDDIKQRVYNNPDIAVPQNMTPNPSSRNVIQDNISFILNRANFVDGKANLGKARPFIWDKDNTTKEIQKP